MKIAIVGAIDTPIRSDSTAGTEIWTYTYGEALKSRGYDVTLFARTGSEFSGKLIPSCDRPLFDGTDGKSLSKKVTPVYCGLQMLDVLKRENDFDLIHLSVYSVQHYLDLTTLFSKPIVVTFHGSPLADEDMASIFCDLPKLNYVFISKQYEKRWPKIKNHRVIYNGVNINDFVFQEKKEDYYFWMGRISPEKGIEDAIEFAKITKNKLIIAGAVRDQEYFEKAIKPFLSKSIKYVGKLDFKAKVDYYRRAKAFLMPIKWEEPFGLVVVESLACGTPVIAYNRGAMGEIIEDGKDGFLVEPGSIDGLIEASGKLDKIKPMDCRTKADMFSLDKMVDSYLRYYQDILKTN